MAKKKALNMLYLPKCWKCGTEMEFKDEFDFEKNKTSWYAKCTKCDVQTSVFASAEDAAQSALDIADYYDRIRNPNKRKARA